MHDNVQPTGEQSRTCGARRPGWDQGPAVGRHRIPCVLPVGHTDDHRNALDDTWPDEQADVRRSVDAQFPAVAAFLAEDVARPDADLMRGDAVLVDGPRVVTVPLHNAPGSTLSVTCPEWCVSEHREEAGHGAYASDFSHMGAQVELSPGGEVLLSASLAQSPFGSGDRRPIVATWPETNGDLDERGVLDLADQLRAYAVDLDDLAVDLLNARSVDSGEGQADAAAVEGPVSARDLDTLCTEYEQAAEARMALFEGLSAERLDRIEDERDADAPAELIAERLAELARWQKQLSGLEAAAGDAPEFRAGLASHRQLWQAMHARTTAAFTGWYFGGWSALPEDNTAEETDR